MSNQVHVLSRRAEDRMIESFMAEAQKAIEKKAKRKEKARLRTKTAPLSDDAEYFKRLSIERQVLVDLRLKRGYLRIGQAELSDMPLQFMKAEEGLRSVTLESNAAAMWPSLVRKRTHLRAAWTNGSIAGTDSKLLALDMPYVEGNREFLGFIRIDTDLIWNSVDAIMYALQELVSDGKLPCMPHFIVGLLLSDGRFVRPHLIWNLPYGQAVWNDVSHEKWRKAPVDLFRSTYYGLVENMINLGTDPGAPWGTQRVKNPLCPEWHTVCPQDEHFPDLKTISEYVDLGATRERATRKAAAFQSQHGIEASNEIFNTFSKSAFDCLRTWHFSGDQDYHQAMMTSGRGAVIQRIFSFLQTIEISAAVRRKWNDESLAAVMEKVADYAAQAWDVSKVDTRTVNRHSCMHMIASSDGLAERQATGARYAAQLNAEKSLSELAAAIGEMQEAGIEITKKAVARHSGLGLSTVRRRWAEVELLLSSQEGGVKQCIGKKDEQPSIITETTNHNMFGTVLVESRNLNLVAESESELSESEIPKIAPETGEWWMGSSTVDDDDDYSNSADDDIGAGYSFTEETDFDDYDGGNPYAD